MAPLPSSFPLRTAALLLVGGLALPGLADNKSEPAASVAENTPLEEVTIIGDRKAAREIAGSGALIDSLQIRDELATDINQLLKTVPGTYIREEDGYGLRPNIGIRGATAERSAKITLMEDGVLIAPAPYAAPEAYYFPTLARMQAVEVLKGASQLRYGPQTTGGVVNLVSTPQPENAGGRLQLVYGQDHQADMLASYGGRLGAFGFNLETAQRYNEGFKSVDRSDQDTGYQIEDYVAKLSWQGEQHALKLKAQYSDETSDETYLGLTDRDFAEDPDRRYGMSAPDQMSNQHQALSLTWDWQLGAEVALATTVYRNEFHRDWFKLSGGGGLVEAANNGDSDAQAVLDGERDAFGLSYKHNNRRYVSEGVQTNLDWQWGEHTFALGARYHEDEVDRFQPTERYDQINGELILRGVIEPNASNNRLQTAEALSFWVTDAWQISEALRLDLALRHERVKTSETRFDDVGRDQIAATRQNDLSIWLPGVAAFYEINDDWSLLAGIHRGFSPLGGSAREWEKPETSINYELGARYDGPVFVEVIGFYSDFSDKGESCSNAYPCSNGATSGTFVTGEAVVAGVEVQVGHVFETGQMTWPLSLAYTHSKAEARSDAIASDVLSGDTLASVPENTLSLRLGAQIGSRWDSYAVVKYVDDMCVEIGCNRETSQFTQTESFFVVDIGTRYAVTEGISAFVKIENAFDKRAIVSRQPDGARPNKPMTAMLGVEWVF
ncbi:MAG: TonB-dependent receptor [Proteobacteria bacterium]|nr:TonB-dependent receptor [Pseudomonadota bacterium]